MTEEIERKLNQYDILFGHTPTLLMWFTHVLDVYHLSAVADIYFMNWKSAPFSLSCPLCNADVKHIQPLPIAYFHRFRFWARLAEGSSSVLLCLLLYVVDALLLLLAQSAFLLQQGPTFKVCLAPQ